jgi:hypothetical protein
MFPPEFKKNHGIIPWQMYKKATGFCAHGFLFTKSKTGAYLSIIKEIIKYMNISMHRQRLKFKRYLLSRKKAYRNLLQNMLIIDSRLRGNDKYSKSC